MSPELVLNKEFLVVVIAFSLLSGVGAYFQGSREERHKGSYIDFFAESILAVVAGLVAAYSGESLELHRGLTLAIVLIVSNNGSDVLEVLKSTAINRVKSMLKSGGK
jgi:hypothetical protein